MVEDVRIENKVFINADNVKVGVEHIKAAVNMIYIEVFERGVKDLNFEDLSGN
jgi:hypothetical protein